MKIKNFSTLATCQERKALLEIAEAGLSAVDIKNALTSQIKLQNNVLSISEKCYELELFKHIYLCGVGKSAREGCKVLARLLGPRVSGGLVIDIESGNLGKVKVLKGTHPFPSDLNATHTAKLLKFLKAAQESDLILFVVSGGGSTLLTQPTGDFTPQQEAAAVKCLFKAGATIQQLNVFRKHISRARGGGVAKAAYPATLVCLTFSDVPGDNLEFISSGPAVLDDCPLEQAEAIIDQFKLEQCSGLDFKPFLRKTPIDKKFFNRVSNHLVISNKLALRAMQKAAKERGFSCEIVTSQLQGQSEQVAARLFKDLRASKPNSVLLYGGETTVHISGQGQGGRNQHLALLLLELLRTGEFFLCLSSDGRDNSAHAGALADAITLKHALKLGLKRAEFLKNADSFNFFAKSGDFIETGDTGSNVSDLIIAAKLKSVTAEQ